MITVVMSAYNVGEYIEQAMRSVLNSTHKDLELIIVEDCSTDNTLAIAQGIAEEDERVKIIQQPENKGAGWARRTGIEAAQGEYVICIDSDDYITEDFLALLYTRACETDADIVSGGVTQIHDDGSYQKYGYSEKVTEGDDKVLNFWRHEKVSFMNNKLIRKSLHEKYPYCIRRFIEDVPTINPLLQFANKVAYAKTDGYFYRQRSTSLIHDTNPLRDVLYRFLAFQDIIEFFEKENKDMIAKLGIPNTIATYLAQIKQIEITPELIAPYREDWDDFTIRLLKKML